MVALAFAPQSTPLTTARDLMHTVLDRLEMAACTLESRTNAIMLDQGARALDEAIPMLTDAIAGVDTRPAFFEAALSALTEARSQGQQIAERCLGVVPPKRPDLDRFNRQACRWELAARQIAEWLDAR